jgi:hypothetical protein
VVELVVAQEQHRRARGHRLFALLGIWFAAIDFQDEHDGRGLDWMM